MQYNTIDSVLFILKTAEKKERISKERNID